MKYSSEIYKKDQHRYGILASLPIIVAIVHLLFTVFFMTTVSYNESSNSLGNLYTLGELFSVSIFSCILSGQAVNIKSFKAIMALSGVIIGLVMIFLSTAAVKGKKKCFLISFLIYGLDSLFIIPNIILSYTLTSTCKMQIYDIIITVLIHAVFIGLYSYTTLVIKRMNKFEQKEAYENNVIHIHKGDENQ